MISPESVTVRVRRLVRIRAQVWKCPTTVAAAAESAAMNTLGAGRSAALAIMDAYVILAAVRGDNRRVMP